jgi:hypothetical protein
MRRTKARFAGKGDWRINAADRAALGKREVAPDHHEVLGQTVSNDLEKKKAARKFAAFFSCRRV